MDSRLPNDFSDLAIWIDWAQPTELLRNRKRWSASMEDSQDEEMLVRHLSNGVDRCIRGLA